MRILNAGPVPEKAPPSWIVPGQAGFAQDIFRYFQLVQRRAGPSADTDPVFTHFEPGSSFR